MKYLKQIFILSLISILLVGCTTSKAYTWKVETGDNIKISLKTNDGYDINSSTPFEVSKDNNVISYGIFITKGTYNQYKESISNQSNVRMIDQGNKDNVEYIFYEYKDKKSEYNYIIKIDNSDTGIVLANSISEEEAKEVFSRLNFSKE